MHRSPDNAYNAPFQNYLTKEWKVSQLNEHTAQSPLLTEEPSGFYNQQKIRDSFSFIVLTIENIYLKLYFC